MNDTASSAPTRRTVIKGAAWSVPVIAAAIAAPLSAASTPNAKPAGVTCGDTDSANNGTYTVFEDSIVVQYDQAPDLYEANVEFTDGTSLSYGTNHQTAPAPGSRTWSVPTGRPVSWVQVHGFDTHFQNGTCLV